MSFWTVFGKFDTSGTILGYAFVQEIPVHNRGSCPRVTVWSRLCVAASGKFVTGDPDLKR